MRCSIFLCCLGFKSSLGSGSTESFRLVGFGSAALTARSARASVSLCFVDLVLVACLAPFVSLAHCRTWRRQWLRLTSLGVQMWFLWLGSQSTDQDLVLQQHVSSKAMEITDPEPH